MIDHIVVDIEIRKTVEETPGGWDATDKLGVSVGVVYEYPTDRYRIYGPDDVEKLQHRLIAAERISGFNIWQFDFPVIFGLPRGSTLPIEPLKTNDMLRRIWQALKLNPDEFSGLHKNWGLDIVCKGTLGRGKTGYGGDAPKWYQAGDWARLVDYCIDDVKLERDLTDFVDRHGYVVNGNTDQVLRLAR